MKLLTRTVALEKDKSGLIALVPQDKEDLWQLYNLIQAGDELELSTFRNVKKTEGSKSERRLLRLRLRVQSVDYAPSDEVMRVSGKTTQQHEHVPNQSFHTAEVQLHKKLTLAKAEWDAVSVRLVAEALLIERRAEVGAVVLEEGVAHLCLVTDNMTVLRNKIERLIPKKGRDGSSHDRSMAKFLELVLQTVLRNFDFDKLKVVVLALPGFTAAALEQAIVAAAVAADNKSVLKNRGKLLVAHSSTGYLQGLEEVLQDPGVQRSLADTKFAREAAVFSEFQKVLGADDGRAWYGPREVEQAVELGAVQSLLLTDALFRSDSVAERRHYIRLSDAVKRAGGEVFVFSTQHESGEELARLTGAAAILKYPVELDE